MSRQDKKSTYYQRRPERPKVHHESNEGWAVSYSDFLMVLLSFFVIYFNVNNDKTIQNEKFNNVVFKLANSKFLQATEKNKVTGETQGDSAITAEQKKNIESIALKFKNSGNQISENSSNQRDISSLKKDSLVESLSTGFSGKGKGKALGKNKEKEPAGSAKKKVELVIDLSENLFELGSFSLNEKVKTELNQIFKIIQEDRDSVNMVFIGHTDKLQFKEKSNSVVNSNLILSSLRAAKAVEYAIAQGFDGNQVFVQGLNVQPRNTRSLSIKLVER
ncbi:MAG: OmpA family protein [Halobacteriovoraceae bacterium]|nr:OmpA family protein [Halobacteriovoraceae bacterium]MCB9094214.1 OmpA family protein [Halobacteriovoraceae bacterium]